MSKSEEKLLTWLLTLGSAVVILLGLQVWLSLSFDRTPSKLHPERNPSSLEMLSNSAMSKPEQAVTLNWNCQEEGLSSYDIGAAHLRLVGTLCSDLKNHKITVINKTNGFTASLFFQRTQSFTTDFLDLREGKNIIEVSASQGDQQTLLKSFTINRTVF